MIVRIISKFLLCVAVLRAVANGRCSPSRNVYSANISYDRVVRYLKFLREQGLVERAEKEKKKRFRITDRGLEVIRYFDKVEKCLFYRRRAVSSIKIHFPRK